MTDGHTGANAPNHYAYDVETPINLFTCVIQHVIFPGRWVFEISERRDQSRDLVSFIYHLRNSGASLVGFNNENFDYPILHFLIKTFETLGYVTPQMIYQKAQMIIGGDDRFGQVIWPNERIIPQIDLFKIHHFDNKAKTTSLKILEFNMRDASIEDLPFGVHDPIPVEDIPSVIKYNATDVAATVKFYHHTWPMIAFRAKLTEKLGQDFTNYNDTKIGKETFIMRLEKARPGICFTRERGKGKTPRQTFRSSINLGSVIFPYVGFKTGEFHRVHDYLRGTTVTQTKEPPELKGLSATLAGFQFDFGTGGIHGSVTNQSVRADDEYEIVDIDVTSFYPSLPIVNRYYPEHLSELFCDIYEDIKIERVSYTKGTAENAMLKLALNGVYGDSNNIYSPFFDPAYTMKTTVNGQLLLCMLAERLMLEVPDLRMVQINTDGMTVQIPRTARAVLDTICKEWEAYTRLELEFAQYDKMFIRDVNNYLAVDLKGKVKRKGVYQWDTSDPNNVSVSRTWSQDWSALIIPRAVEEVLCRDADLTQFINGHADAFDFMLREKVPRNSRLMLTHDGGTETQIQNVSRYQIATSGPKLVKLMPPTSNQRAAGKDDDRRMRIAVGWSVNVCNDLKDWRWDLLDRSYYIKEAEKLMGMK